MGRFRVVRHLATGCPRAHHRHMELLFVLIAVILLDIAAVLFGTDSREHTLSGGAGHAIS